MLINWFYNSFYKSLSQFLFLHAFSLQNVFTFVILTSCIYLVFALCMWLLFTSCVCLLWGAKVESWPPEFHRLFCPVLPPRHCRWWAKRWDMHRSLVLFSQLFCSFFAGISGGSCVPATIQLFMGHPLPLSLNVRWQQVPSERPLLLHSQFWRCSMGVFTWVPQLLSVFSQLPALHSQCLLKFQVRFRLPWVDSD